MKQVIIDNPIINSPFEEPARHFRFVENNITEHLDDGRRVSSYFVPIAQPKKRHQQTPLFDDFEPSAVEENKEINQLRQKVDVWRKRGYSNISTVTRELLSYWTDPQRDRRLFFCQIEALETAIYITEAASRLGDNWTDQFLKTANQNANPLLHRIGIKMATGTGKTIVMAMLITWQTLNKIAYPQDPRFSNTFLIVTPGITIRDRLRVLLPNNRPNCYKDLNLLPNEKLAELNKANILITNYHAFMLHEQGDAGRLTKNILAQGKKNAFTEMPEEMVHRVCREFGKKKNIIVFNDEAHHCYRRRPEPESADKLKGDDRKEAEQRNEEARVWISGLEAVKQKIGIRAVYDLSATPFFLSGSGYPEGTLFPWIVSDFSLIDAIESGIVKVPRVPIADNQMTGTQPTYRNLWLNIRDELPKKTRDNERMGEPKPPPALEGALQSLYANYQKAYDAWEPNENRGSTSTPPVFIVVCNNTSVSKMVFDYIAGWDKTLPDGTTVAVPGKLKLFSNVERNRWIPRPNTILVDSHQLESGEGMSADFKKIAAREIAEFKDELRRRFPGRDAEELTEEDLLREVMNTVGKPGKLGENIKCVVSVSMLTEGWDANTVTHILGVRAFGTRLLCEQVIGRALRRVSTAVNAKGHFDPEYAEVYGVPFSFIPCSGGGEPPPPLPDPTHVCAVESRQACMLRFPRLTGYRFEIPEGRLTANFTPDSRMVLSTAELPTSVENAPIVGTHSFLNLDELKNRRENEVAFQIAKVVLEKYFSDEKDPSTNLQSWRFPELLAITKRWLDECVVCKDDTFKQLLLLVQKAHNAADRVYRAIVPATSGAQTLKPILMPYEAEGSTAHIDFLTRRPTYDTRPDKCHISHVVADTDSWEQKLAQTLEDMPEVLAYAKNQNLGFFIPYNIDGNERKYYPDFLARLNHPVGQMLNLILECTGQKEEDKQAKVDTAKNLWVPAVNNHGGFGRWAFLEITDPWDAKNLIRRWLCGRPVSER
ncbi:MAG: restriction endonuclease subunit R [Gemmataceae bacterium]|nr:restriction endonuclease subunit R [Gemmataceae bacterium]